MPNTFIANRDEWLRMSEVDYLGQFVKAWLAFNAWYRSAYTESQDRKIINEIKWQANPVLSKLRPLLETESEEAEQFRAEIGLLHHRLERYELHSGKDSEKVQITLCNVYLQDKGPFSEPLQRNGITFLVERQAGGQMRIDVRRGTTIKLQHTQNKFDLADLESQTAYQSLNTNQQITLRQLYSRAAPKWIANLMTHRDLDPNTREIKCGAYPFNCGRDALYAGVVEVIYQMRCTLFHGELIPTKEAIACYEPAYRLVRRFLDCVT